MTRQEWTKNLLKPNITAVTTSIDCTQNADICSTSDANSICGSDGTCVCNPGYEVSVDKCEGEH